jgi:hypothetical protein
MNNKKSFTPSFTPGALEKQKSAETGIITQPHKYPNGKNERGERSGGIPASK